MRRIVLAAFALTVLAACQSATTELTEQQKAEIAAEVELLHGQFWDAWRAADIDRGWTFYPDIPEVSYATDGELFVGLSAIEDNDRSNFAHIASQTITITESHTTVVARNVVCINELAKWTVTDTSGATTPERVFAGTYVWVLRDGEWKVQFSHESIPASDSQ